MSRIESRIYLFRWVGKVTAVAARESLFDDIETIQEAGEAPFIGIHDLKGVDRLPPDIRGFTKMVNEARSHLAFTILVNAPPGAAAIMKVMQVFAPTLREVRVCNTMDEAIVAAQSVLKVLNAESGEGD